MRAAFKYSLLLLLTVYSLFINAQVVKVQTGAHITTTGGVVITLADMNLDNDGSINQLTGQGRFVFNGGINTTISGTAVPLFDHLEIGKTGNQHISLQQPVYIGSGIIFTSGNIDLNTNNILLQPGALLMGESATSRLTGSNGGYVQINAVLNAPANADPGNLGISITSSQNLGTTLIRRGHQSQVNAHNLGASMLRYYDILPANNTALQATLRINYFDTELNSLDEDQLAMFSSPDALHWTNNGYSTRSATGNYVEQTNFNTLHRFTLSEVNNALPLVWGTFNTRCVNGQSRLNWKTLQEQNTARFVIRRSTNGIAWTNIGSLAAAGYSQSTLNYSFIDREPLTGIMYYQILQQDVDGHQTLSPVLVSRCELPQDISVYPNPVTSNCVITIPSMTATTATLRIYNNQAALLQQQAFAIQEGTNQLVLSLDHYPPGTYVLTILLKGTVKTIKLQKL